MAGSARSQSTFTWYIFWWRLSAGICVTRADYTWHVEIPEKLICAGVKVLQVRLGRGECGGNEGGIKSETQGSESEWTHSGSTSRNICSDLRLDPSCDCKGWWWLLGFHRRSANSWISSPTPTPTPMSHR